MNVIAAMQNLQNERDRCRHHSMPIHGSIRSLMIDDVISEMEDVKK